MVEVRYAGFNEPHFGEDHVNISSMVSTLTLPARGNMFDILTRVVPRIFSSLSKAKGRFLLSSRKRGI